MNHSLETNITDSMNVKNTQNATFVGITAITGGVSVAMVALVAIFSPNNITVAPWIVGGLSIMGIALGYFSSKRG